MSTLADPTRTQPLPAVADRYPGVLPFGDTALDRLRFFGRDDEARLLLQQLLSSELLVLFAKSGLGKTSLLNARICALLRERDFLPLPVRFNHTDASLTPLTVITTAIEQACTTEQIDYTPGIGESLWEFFKTAIFLRGERLQTPIFVLDHFEEIFMLQKQNFCQDAAAELWELTARRLPDRIIRRLQKGETLPFSDKPTEVKVLISLREEYLGMLQVMTPQISAILQNRFRLTGLSADDARRAIVKPAALISEEIQFAAHPFAYTENAIEDMVAAARTEDSIDPFFLQILCSHVERQVRQRQAGELSAMVVKVDSGYLGGEHGIKTVATDFYLDAVNRISDPEVRHRVRELCEEGLLTAAGSRRSLLQEDIEATYGVDGRSLDVLEKVHLLHKEPRHSSFYYEISHERLGAAIYEKRVPRELKVEVEKRLRVMEQLTRDEQKVAGPTTQKHETLYDFVISYAPNDKQIANSIVRKLQDAGVSVWDYFHNLRVGIDMAELSLEAVTHTKAIVLLIGDKSYGREERFFDLYESYFAAEYALRSRRDIAIFPVLLPGANASNLPIELSRRRYFTLEDSMEASLTKVLRWLLLEIAVLDKSVPRPRIFLCHAKEDDGRVADLFYRLIDQGFDPWYDKEKLDVGDRWEDEIISAIENSDFFAVCFSQKAVKKEGFVQKEIRTAIRQFQLRSFDLAFLLPIRLEECEIPNIRIDENTTLRSVQWADLFPNDTRAFSRFVSGIWKQWKRKRSKKD
jgi:hypothetical protein